MVEEGPLVIVPVTEPLWANASNWCPLVYYRFRQGALVPKLAALFAHPIVKQPTRNKHIYPELSLVIASGETAPGTCVCIAFALSSERGLAWSSPCEPQRGHQLYQEPSL